MRILVIEDDPKHTKDVKAVVAMLKDCTVDFATSLNEAEALLQEQTYDGAICDVFFPTEPGGPADSYENAIVVSNLLTARGVHHVFNTSGNHHGSKYEGFIWKTPRATHTDNPGDAEACHDFRTAGMIIEAYPKDDNADKDTKQWRAAFRYILLSVTMLRLPDKGQSIVDDKHGPGYGFPYGDYGKLGERFDFQVQHPKYTFVIETLARYNA